MYDQAQEKIESLAIDASDVVETLTDMADELYFDENEAEEVETRLDTIRALKRKYGANKAAIDAFLQEAKAEYELLSDCEGQYAELTTKLAKKDKEIYHCCQKITALRKASGTSFCERVIAELTTLNIPHATFCIQFDEYTETDVNKANTSGLDCVRFMFSANAGEPVKPLGKIISGGEMSRFMLAVKTQLSSINEISTYIFDEIDAGISGVTAKVVGEKLANIATKTQIIAVSHLAQIAVMSDNEFLIEKQEINGKTLTQVYALDEEQKTQEIVRLIGGESGEIALKHAQALLEQAKQYKLMIS
jgi:DNA repair protein RecN (Recombination protein N)